MNLDDPFVRAIGQVVLGALVAALACVGVLTLGVLVDWYFTDGNGPGNDRLARLVQMLPPLSGPAINEVQNIVAILLTAVPLLVTPVCFLPQQAAAPAGPAEGAAAPAATPAPSRRLNRFGKVLVVVLLLVMAMCTLAYVGIKPSDWEHNHVLELDGSTHAQNWALAALRGAVFYFAALLGLRAMK